MELDIIIKQMAEEKKKNIQRKERLMEKLEKIIGGSINLWGGVDKNYSPTGFSINQGGVIRDGYSDTGCRVMENGSIRDGYYRDTGLSINSFNIVKRGY